jgi:DNA-binding CsgD family transcriptional regulator
VAGIIGRGPELDALWQFLKSVSTGPAALLLSGDPGIGKTTLWREGVAGALQLSYRTLACAPAEAETRLSYAALGDLIEPVLEETLDFLPEPQRAALEVALLRSSSTGSRSDQRAVSLAVLGCLRSLASASPVVVAIDDVQWIDVPTARVLQFVLRRLKQDPVGFLTAARAADPEGDPLDISSALLEERVDRLRVAPLSVDALDEVIRSRLGTGFVRRTLLQLHETSGGNPFFALEIALALRRRGGEVPAGEALPIPDRLHELIRDRLDGLPPRTLEALRVVSALSAPTLDRVAAALSSPRGVDARMRPAIDHKVVEVADRRVRFTHPLLASAAYQAMSDDRRRDLHRRLAATADDVEERAHHLALSVAGPDAAVSDALDEAARRAASRGAPQSAAELWEMAARATPPEQQDDLRRRMHEGGLAHFECGNTSLARRLLQEAVDRSDPGAQRARALQDLGMVAAGEAGWRQAGDLFDRALREAGDDVGLRASIEQRLGYTWLFLGDVAASERHARQALELAESVGEPWLMAEAFQAYPFVRFLLGGGPDFDMLERGVALEQHLVDGFHTHVLRPTFTLALLLKYCDRLDEARERFQALLTDASERGFEAPMAPLHCHLAELECRAGRWESALAHAHESMWAARQTATAFYRAMALYAEALVEAHRGRVDAARLTAEEGLRVTEDAGEVLTMVQILSVMGFVELSLGEHEAAHRHLARAIERKDAMGVEEPAYFRIVPDDVEALVALGRLDEAEELLTPFEEVGRRLDRAWALATAARCRALLCAARGDHAAASEAINEALREHERLPLPFELGRTLLVKGTVERRAKRKRDARESLERARGAFETLGAAIWTERAQAELARIGGRAPAPLSLTPTEGKVAELVAAGNTNREVADTLFVSVHTVEANLKRIYRKLGIRSRTELASRFRPASGS